jgi:hypothetical protein
VPHFICNLLLQDAGEPLMAAMNDPGGFIPNFQTELKIWGNLRYTSPLKKKNPNTLTQIALLHPDMLTFPSSVPFPFLPSHLPLAVLLVAHIWSMAAVL